MTMARAQIIQVGHIDIGPDDVICIRDWTFDYGPDGRGTGLLLDADECDVVVCGYTLNELIRVATLYHELGYWVL